KLMVVIRAEPMSFESIIDRMQDMRVRDFNGSFTPEDRSRMMKQGPTLTEIFTNGLDPYARFTASGDRVIGFNVNKELASIETIGKNIEVKIKARGFKQEAIRTVENLMISG